MRFVRPLLCLLFLPTLFMAQAQTVPGDASEKAKILGVESYQYHRDAKVIDIELLGSDGEAVDASVRLEFDTPEGLLIDYSGDKGPLSITWSPMLSNPEVRIEDPTRGILLHRTYDAENQVWVRHSRERGNEEKLMAARSRALEVTMAAVDDALFNLGLNMYFSNLPSENSNSEEFSENVSEDQFGGCSPQCPSACTGQWYRGDAVATTASACCYQATNEANNRCTQAGCYCFGCCQLLSCDSACGIGDYFCVCGRSGRSCGPDPFCDDNWPPDCI